VTLIQRPDAIVETHPRDDPDWRGREGLQHSGFSPYTDEPYAKREAAKTKSRNLLPTVENIKRGETPELPVSPEPGEAPPQNYTGIFVPNPEHEEDA
jgi:hypothetical protein